jgi:hypothetical protein
VQWLRLLEALASPESQPALPHLGLRTSSAAALRDVCTRASASLAAILAETRQGDVLDDVNGVLAAVYAELEQVQGARLARRVFALAGDGFPGPSEGEMIATWDGVMRAMHDGRLTVAGLPAAKRDVVVAVIGHYLAAQAPLDTLAAGAAGDPQPTTATRLDWLVALARWRRFARACRALGKVLTPAERQRLVAAAEQLDARPVRSGLVDWGSSTGSQPVGGTW